MKTPLRISRKRFNYTLESLIEEYKIIPEEDLIIKPIRVKDIGIEKSEFQKILHNL